MMKKFKIIFLLFVFSNIVFVYGQTEETVMEEVEMEDEPETSDEASFAVIEEVPVFPGCLGTPKEQKACFNKSMQMHVRKNFNLALADRLNLEHGTKRIYIAFKISKTGEIANDILVRAPHPALKAEAIRVVKLLPKMTPGKQRGREINVRYTLPILFKVDGKPRQPIEEKEVKDKIKKVKKKKKRVEN